MEKELELDLMELFYIILRKWKLIVAACIVFASLGGVYAYTRLEDEYTASSSMIVQVTNNGDSEYTNLLRGQTLVGTYTEISESTHALSELKSNLELDYSIATLKDMITITGVSDTLIIGLKVESFNPKEAEEIANELVLIVQRLSIEYEGLDNVEILDVATIPNSPSGPNRLMYIAIGFVLGGMLSVITVLAFEFLDRSVKTSKDLENSLGIRLLTSISDYKVENEVGHYGKS